VLLFTVLAVSTTILTGGLGAAQQAPGNEALPGVVNYTRIDANLAVGGVLSLQALPELKRRGFKTVINLRKASEPDANVEAEGVAVRGAGLKYVNLPFSATDPYEVAAAQVEPFMKALADPSNLPVLIHSRQAHRPVGLLLIKRVLRDGWSLDKGFGAADAQVLADGTEGAAGVRQFVLSYIKAHSR
jgi:protein tyrosine phosphatase (PTP) superfamily phosphohydrolase (DUF442 family)